MSSGKILWLIAGLVIISGAYFALSNSDASDQSDTKTLTFIMAHKPDNADNASLIQEFADRVFQRTDGVIKIIPVDPESLSTGESNPRERYIKALDEVIAGNAGMSQVSVTSFSSTYPDSFPLDALNAPDVFADHAHAARVLDGTVGDDLRDVVDKGSNGKLHALSFTYSGGYRDILSTKSVSSLSELSGMSMPVSQYLSRDFLGSLGISMLEGVTNESLAWQQKFMDGSLQAEEAELIRIETYRANYPEVFKKIKTIVETNHNLFLTLLVVNGEFFDSLTSEQQNIISEEAHALALKERVLSIQQGIDARAGFIKDGISIVIPTAAEVAVLESGAQSVRAKYQDTLGVWFDRIAAEI